MPREPNKVLENILAKGSAAPYDVHPNLMPSHEAITDREALLLLQEAKKIALFTHALDDAKRGLKDAEAAQDDESVKAQRTRTRVIRAELVPLKRGFIEKLRLDYSVMEMAWPGEVAVRTYEPEAGVHTGSVATPLEVKFFRWRDNSFIADDGEIF